MNILLVVVDEMRYPVSYETEELKKWRKDNLVFYEKLKDLGTEFCNHFTNTNACVPSRTTLHTGVYPSVHGNISTDGISKSSNDDLMTWLTPKSVPTIGNYLSENGYICYLKGKWHISDSSIKGKNGNILPTFDCYGKRDENMELIYKHKNVLKDYGYNEWIGPDPHGILALNTGSSVPKTKKGRDSSYIDQTIETLQKYNKKNPWFISLNMVDPHDIALYGKGASKIPNSFDFEIDESLPLKMFTDDFESSANEDLINKPKVQSNYKNIYETLFQPLFDNEKNARYYYTLMKRVDSQLCRFWEYFEKSKYFKNSVTIFTSDHGELLGAHGLNQKWFQAYQESIKIPLVIYGAKLNHLCKKVDTLTSHIDILPTICNIADIDPQFGLKNFCDYKNFILPQGKSLLHHIFDTKSKFYQDDVVYFYTEDNPTVGKNTKNYRDQSYEPLIGSTNVEAIITRIDGCLWKLIHYYPNSDTILFELYNLDQDQMELNNLFLNQNFKNLFERLRMCLHEQSFMYRKIENQYF